MIEERIQSLLQRASMAASNCLWSLTASELRACARLVRYKDTKRYHNFLHGARVFDRLERSAA